MVSPFKSGKVSASPRDVVEEQQEGGWLVSPSSSRKSKEKKHHWVILKAEGMLKDRMPHELELNDGRKTPFHRRKKNPRLGQKNLKGTDTSEKRLKDLDTGDYATMQKTGHVHQAYKKEELDAFNILTFPESSASPSKSGLKGRSKVFDNALNRHKNGTKRMERKSIRDALGHFVKALMGRRENCYKPNRYGDRSPKHVNAINTTRSYINELLIAHKEMAGGSGKVKEGKADQQSPVSPRALFP